MRSSVMGLHATVPNRVRLNELTDLVLFSMFQYMTLLSDGSETNMDGLALDTSTVLQLSELLGSGRHGTVFAGERSDGACTRQVAVKVPNDPAGLRHEGVALRRFRNPHIIQLIDGPLDNGALVLERCDLGTLADRLAQRSLTLNELRGFLDSMILALSYIHEAGWIHGDVSPTNVGLRSGSGPVLFDFATARPSDGTAIDEGNIEFAGPLRRADSRLDVRSLAATALHALGETDRWDNHKTRIQAQLATLIERCDRHDSVDLAELAEVVWGVEAVMPSGAPGGSSPMTTEAHRQSTRTFGPRPDGTPASVGDSSSSHVTHLVQRLWVPAVALLVVAFVASELLFSHTSVDEWSGPGQLTEEFTASESLQQGGATWDVRAGVVTLSTLDGSTRMAAGEAGDAAAIGDWSCDGFETLGVYRPRTGSWFVFDSWLPDSSSGDPDQLTTDADLFVHVDSTGCARPVARRGAQSSFSDAVE